MNEISLHTARQIMQLVSAYSGPMDLDSIVASMVLQTDHPKEVVLKVIEFLQELKKPAQTAQNLTAVTEPAVPATVPPLQIEEGPIDMFTEFSFNYQVAKALLKQTLVDRSSIDPEETRKNLKIISAFMESMLKFQERLLNVQQIQRFQDAVLAELDLCDSSLRDRVVARIQEADL